MNGTRKCSSLPTCDRKVFARALCRSHWQTWRDAKADPCALPECATPARAAGLCNLHWQRRYTKGSFDDPIIKSVDERFFEKIDKTESCWLWVGSLFDTGYGAFNSGQVDGKSKVVSAHRFAYERIHGKQSSRMHLDHLCRVPRCCNPDHLELVTPSENNNRGNAGPKELCARGHSMIDAYIRPDTGSRMCRPCQKIRERKRRGNTHKST